MQAAYAAQGFDGTEVCLTRSLTAFASNRELFAAGSAKIE